RRLCRSAVARDPDEVDRQRKIDCAHQVREKDARALEHPEQMKILAREVASDLLPHLNDALLQLLFAYQDFQVGVSLEGRLISCAHHLPPARLVSWRAAIYETHLFVSNSCVSAPFDCREIYRESDRLQLGIETILLAVRRLRT